jgi:phospholipase/carboxylesterase
MRIDANAVLWSAPEEQHADRPLLVLLHGYGSHEGDLFGLSPHLPLEPVVASLRAPLQENGGFAWWSLLGQAPGSPDPAAVNEAVRAVLDWLDEQEFSRVSLLGFSQGAAMSLQLLRHAPERFSSVVALSGFVVDGHLDGDERLTSLRPPVFWGRGTEDTVIPASAIERTETWLPFHATVTTRVYEGLAHSVSPAELTELSAFLTEHPA